MKSLRMRLGLLLLGFGMAAAAAPPKQAFSEKQLAQQQRMTDCSADAKEKALRGNERMAFMKTCLAGGQVTVEVGDETLTARPPASLREEVKHCDGERGGMALEGSCVAQ